MKTRSWALPARLRSSSREIPPRSGILGVEGLEEAQRLGAQALARVAMQVPLAIHRDDAAVVLELVEELRGAAQARRASGARRSATRAPAAPACFRCSSSTAGGLAGGEQRQVGGERGPLALEARRRDVEQRAAADRHDGRVGAHHEAVARQRHHRRLQPEAAHDRTRRARARAGPRGRTRAITSWVPTWKRTRSRVLTGRGASSRSSSVPSSRSVGTSVPAGASTSPRSMAARSTPWRFTAVRWPALACGTAWPCTCRPRTFACTPRGYTSTASSTAKRARDQRAGDDGAEALDGEHAVDRQARGAGRRSSAGTARARSRERRAQLGQARARLRPTPGRSGSPRGRCGASARRTSSRTSSSQSGSTRSALVSDHEPRRMRSS